VGPAFPDQTKGARDEKGVNRNISAWKDATQWQPNMSKADTTYE
jgi:hypothetical protein